MNLFKTTLAILVIVTAIAFSYSTTPIVSTSFGVCTGLDNDKMVRLDLMKNGDFIYINEHSEKIEGTWKQERAKVFLTPLKELEHFRNEWKLEKGNVAIKSRSCLSFFRLIDLNKCQECK